MFRSIAIVHLRPYVDTVPCLVSLANYLANNGYRIEIFTLSEDGFLKPHFENANIQIHILLGAYTTHSLTVSLNMLTWYWHLLKQMSCKSYQCIIGVDPDGLFLATLLSLTTATPVVYHSLELYFTDELKTVLKRVQKRLEGLCHRHATFAITQDPDRAKLLAIENGIPLSTVMCLPNADLDYVQSKHNNFFHDLLTISSDQKIILHMGVLHDWAMPFELTESTAAWPKDWTLVFHTRMKTSRDDRIVKEIEKRDHNNKVKFSLVPVKHQDLSAVASSADVGLAFYKRIEGPAMGKNIDHTGLSSGKIAQYLQNGVPIIINELPLISDIVRRYGCGISISKLSELQHAIKTVLDDHVNYCENARRCYQEIYKPEHYLGSILGRMNSLSPISALNKTSNENNGKLS